MPIFLGPLLGETTLQFSGMQQYYHYILLYPTVFPLYFNIFFKHGELLSFLLLGEKPMFQTRIPHIQVVAAKKPPLRPSLPPSSSKNMTCAVDFGVGQHDRLGAEEWQFQLPNMVTLPTRIEIETTKDNNN